MLNRWFFKHIDNSALVVFRAFFGLLITLEATGSIFTGWIQHNLINPKFTFTFIGFGFLQPLPGNGMFYYYAILGVLGIFVMLGFKYRFSMFSFTLLWSAVYLMQKTSYNNHYYLLMLLGIIMLFLPAHRNFSVDAYRNPALKKISMPRWVWLLIVIQLWMVYSYASIAKLYPDWLNGTMPKILMASKAHYWLVGSFLQQGWIRYAITYFGLLFDLLIIPLLLWKKTRLPAFILAIFFHLFNSFIFHIGIFPYLSLAFCIFFFPSEKINKIFLRKKKPLYTKAEVIVPKFKTPILVVLAVWLLVQFVLPLRHWFFKDDVLWTEEGHRLSWRMMLRSKRGHAIFKVVPKGSNDTITVNEDHYLTRKQQAAVSCKPDMIWQFSQHLKKDYAKKGKDVAVFVDAKVGVNGRQMHRFIDPEVDMAAAKWRHFSHNPWILPSPKE